MDFSGLKSFINKKIITLIMRALSTQACKRRDLRVASFNILNTKDRYAEREAWLKEQIYRLDADLVNLQEVAFGDR